MEKKVNVVRLPTDKAKNCILSFNNRGNVNLEYRGNQYFTQTYLNSINARSQHLHLTSDDEIKDVRPHKGKWHLEKGRVLNKFPNYLTDLSECKLIIATTDKELGLPLIPTDFIKEYEESGGKIDSVVIEMEEYMDKNSTARYNVTNNGECVNASKPKLTSNNEIIIIKQQNYYTKEQFVKFMYKMDEDSSGLYGKGFIDSWVEQNLKEG